MKKENTSIRLKKIMDEKNLKQIDILNLCEPYCKKYGIKMNKSDISQYVSGKVEPNQNKLAILGMALGVSETWLMGFDVAMVNSNLSKSNTNLTKPELDHIDKYRYIDDKGKHTVDTVLDMEYSRCSNIVSISKEKQKKKYEPTEDDIKSLVARNGKTLTREQAIDLISTLFSDDEEE